MSANIDWDEVIKKEARGSDGYDLGEVQEITSEFVLTQKGVVDKKRFEIPKRLVRDFDGNKLVLDLTELDAKNSYLQNKSDSDNNEQRIPLIKEELEPKKYEKEVNAKIVKEPIKETSQVEVELTHEELVIERRPLAEPRKTDEEAVQSRTEIKIPLKREEVEVNKQSYVTEEIIAKKKPVTETTTVSEEVITEKLKDQPETQPEKDLME